MNKELELELLSSMIRIRLVEEEISIRYPDGKMRCPTHLSIGQEAVPAAVGLIVSSKDFAISTHRGHAHYLGKGGNLKSMIAEIYGKASGCSKGKGGSMHLIDRSVGFMGTSAIVGNSIPIGVGLALSAQLKKTKQVSCIFLGEGATEEGVFYESVNFAALRKLPALFLCENNLYSVYSPLSVRQPAGRKITSVASALGLQAEVVDGNDVLACYNSISKAVSDIRNNGCPHLLEFSTYRWREHCGPNYDNNIGYRSEEEFESWKEKDPIHRLEKKLIRQNPKNVSIIENIKQIIRIEIADAFDFAETSDFPDVRDAYLGEYA